MYGEEKRTVKKSQEKALLVESMFLMLPVVFQYSKVNH